MSKIGPQTIEKKELLAFLKRWNCGKCRYLGKSWMQNCCFLKAPDYIKILPDLWFPFVCFNFEPLKDGEVLGTHLRTPKDGG